MILHIVRHSFRSYGEFYPIGTIVTDLDSLRTGRLKVSEGKLWRLDTNQKADFDNKVTTIAARAGKPKEKLLEEIQARVNPKKEDIPPTAPAPSAPPAPPAPVVPPANPAGPPPSTVKPPQVPTTPVKPLTQSPSR